MRKESECERSDEKGEWAGFAKSAMEFGVEKGFTAQKGHVQEHMNLNSFGVEHQVFFPPSQLPK